MDLLHKRHQALYLPPVLPLATVPHSARSPRRASFASTARGRWRHRPAAAASYSREAALHTPGGRAGLSPQRCRPRVSEPPEDRPPAPAILPPRPLPTTLRAPAGPRAAPASCLPDRRSPPPITGLLRERLLLPPMRWRNSPKGPTSLICNGL